ncbi:MAG TPA: hypothetical protein VLD37_05450 [Candidatus Bilamarchaeum sp.]|nr:hypothetical protein [Candidatus Bilamarchaeum sp.]
MLTQKSIPPERLPRKIRSEILVDGFVPSKEPQDRFDIAPQYASVAEFLGGKGFMLQICADFAGQEFHGGDLSGTPWNACLFDAYTNVADPVQARLSTVLRMLTDAVSFRATVIFRREEPIGETCARLRTVYFNYENPAPALALEFMQFAGQAESISVEFRHGIKRGAFTL